MRIQSCTTTHIARVEHVLNTGEVLRATTKQVTKYGGFGTVITRYYFIDSQRVTREKYLMTLNHQE